MTKVVVLGGGPAGDVAALRAAQLGSEVTMIERAELGGTCLNWGCIPTKSLLASADLLRKIKRSSEFGINVGEVSIDFPRMMARKEEIVVKLRTGVEGACKRRKINLIKGEGKIVGDAVAVGDQNFPFDHLVVCVGTEVAGLPGIKMEHPRVWTSNDVLRAEFIPKNLLVIGGGVIGCEFASFFAPLGSEITVVELLPQILTGVEPSIGKSFQTSMESQGVKFLTGRKLAEVTAYRDDGLDVRLDDGTQLSCNAMLVSIGRKPQTTGIGLQEAGVQVNERGHIVVDEFLHTSHPKIWAAGDCIGGQQLAHLASAEAKRAVENALGDLVMPMDRTVVPACIYTHPEIATVGLTTDAAREAGYEVKTSTARFANDGKALGEGEPDGLAQLVFAADSGVILGATIIGVHSVEIVHEIAVAMSDSLTVDDLGSIIHAHPTVSEMVMDAAEVGAGVAPYLS